MHAGKGAGPVPGTIVRRRGMGADSKFHHGQRHGQLLRQGVLLRRIASDDGVAPHAAAGEPGLGRGRVRRRHGAEGPVRIPDRRLHGHRPGRRPAEAGTEGGESPLNGDHQGSIGTGGGNRPPSTAPRSGPPKRTGTPAGDWGCAPPPGWKISSAGSLPSPAEPLSSEARDLSSSSAIRKSWFSHFGSIFRQNPIFKIGTRAFRFFCITCGRRACRSRPV